MAILTLAKTGFVLSLILQVSPPSRVESMQARKETQESISQRLESIANDIVEIVWDPKIGPVFKGPYGRELTAGMLVTTFVEESNFRAEVDDGTVRGDSGASWCLGQIKLSNMRIKFEDNGFYSYSQNKEGYSGKDLVTDRKLCVDSALRVLRTSQDYCKHITGASNRFAAYASGKCSIGQDVSRRRVERAVKIVQETMGLSIKR